MHSRKIQTYFSHYGNGNPPANVVAGCNGSHYLCPTKHCSTFSFQINTYFLLSQAPAKQCDFIRSRYMFRCETHNNNIDNITYIVNTDLETRSLIALRVRGSLLIRCSLLRHQTRRSLRNLRTPFVPATHRSKISIDTYFVNSIESSHR